MTSLNAARSFVGAMLFVIALSASAKVPIGMAAADASITCADFGGATLAAGTEITLVFAEVPQTIARARVGKKIESCAPLTETDGKPPYYVLRGIDREAPWVAIAVAARANVDRTGRVRAELDGRTPRETFRVCTSYEGAHFTAWSGRRRIWHAYHYLGYDVEPTCTDDDIPQ